MAEMFCNRGPLEPMTQFMTRALRKCVFPGLLSVVLSGSSPVSRTNRKLRKRLSFLCNPCKKIPMDRGKTPALNGIGLNDSIPPILPLRDLRTNLHRKELDSPVFPGVFSDRFFAQTMVQAGFMWPRRRGNSRAFPLLRAAVSVPSWRTPSASSPGWSVPSATGWS